MLCETVLLPRADSNIHLCCIHFVRLLPLRYCHRVKFRRGGEKCVIIQSACHTSQPSVTHMKIPTDFHSCVHIYTYDLHITWTRLVFKMQWWLWSDQQRSDGKLRWACVYSGVILMKLWGLSAQWITTLTSQCGFCENPKQSDNRQNDFYVIKRWWAVLLSHRIKCLCCFDAEQL